MPGSLTEQLDLLYTTTWANRRQGVADNIFEMTAFYFWLKEKGGMDTEEGGRRIEENLRYAKSDNVMWIGKGGTVKMGDMDHLTIAYYPWRYLVDSIVRFFADDQKNRSKSKILDIANSKIDTSQDTLVEELEKRLIGSGEGLQMLGLQDLVSDDPTVAGNLGGIDQATYPWWRNQYHTAGTDFATQGINRMRKMLNDCTNNLGMDRPEIILNSQSVYEAYDEETEAQRRVVNKTLGDAGFENIEYKGVPLIWTPYMDDSAGNGRQYFLNTRFLKFIDDPMFYFEATDWKPIPNQVNDRAMQIITACNMVTNRRRCHGVISNITT